MEIPESKRSKIGIIAEFRGIPNGFPNLGVVRSFITGIEAHANTRHQKHQAVVDLVQYDGTNNVQLSA
jgi:hypothetical protein